MKAIYLNYKVKNNIEEFGEDLNNILIYFRTEQTLVEIPIRISYEKLLNYIKLIDAPAFDYLTKIRSTIHGYGPKHSKIFEVIDTEGFDLEKYIIQFINELDESDVDNHISWCENLKVQGFQAKATKIIKNLDEIINEDYINNKIRIDEYRDAVDLNLHELTFKYFPELFDAEEAIIKEYKSALIDTTLNFTSKIDKLIYGLKK